MLMRDDEAERAYFYGTLGAVAGGIFIFLVMALGLSIGFIELSTKKPIKPDYKIIVTDGVPDTTFIYHK